MDISLAFRPRPGTGAELPDDLVAAMVSALPDVEVHPATSEQIDAADAGARERSERFIAFLRAHPNAKPHPAPPPEVLTLVLPALTGAAAKTAIDLAVEWVKERLRRRQYGRGEVRILYGPHGEKLREIEVSAYADFDEE
jgi:hypothetical protein